MVPHSRSFISASSLFGIVPYSRLPNHSSRYYKKWKPNESCNSLGFNMDGLIHHLSVLAIVGVWVVPLDPLADLCLRWLHNTQLGNVFHRRKHPSAVLQSQTQAKRPSWQSIRQPIAAIICVLALPDHLGSGFLGDLATFDHFHSRSNVNRQPLAHQHIVALLGANRCRPPSSCFLTHLDAGIGAIVFARSSKPCRAVLNGAHAALLIVPNRRKKITVVIAVVFAGAQNIAIKIPVIVTDLGGNVFNGGRHSSISLFFYFKISRLFEFF